MFRWDYIEEQSIEQLLAKSDQSSIVEIDLSKSLKFRSTVPVEPPSALGSRQKLLGRSTVSKAGLLSDGIICQSENGTGETNDDTTKHHVRAAG